MRAARALPATVVARRRRNGLPRCAVAAAAAAACAAASGGIAVARAWAWSAPAVVLGPRFRGEGPPSGLRYCTDFVSPTEEAELEAVLAQGTWLQHLKSRAQQFFGLVYYQTSHDLPALQPAEGQGQLGRPMSELPSWLMPRVLGTGVFASREEVNQVAANEYKHTAGIAAHVEDPSSFGANLATLSLLEPVQLTLTPADQELAGTCGVDHGNWVKVLLEPRSLLVLQGESRYAYRHGIRRSKLVQLRGGHALKRGEEYRRVSLTFRELLETRRKLPWEAAACLGDRGVAEPAAQPDVLAAR